jgi:hypothetical protein
MECFIRGGEKCLAEIKNSRHLLIYSNRKKPVSVTLRRPAFRSFGDPFGSPIPQRPQPLVYHCELRGLYTKERPAENPLPSQPFSLQILQEDKNINNFVFAPMASPPPPRAPAPPASSSAHAPASPF